MRNNKSNNMILPMARKLTRFMEVYVLLINFNTREIYWPKINK